MTISFDSEKGLFVAHSIFDENEKLKRAGFTWDTNKKKWITSDYRCADSLLSYCDSVAVFQLRFIKEDLQKSVVKSASAEAGKMPIYHPPNMTPYPFQHAGVEYMLPRPAVLLGDQMGLGKTCQALIVMNMRNPVEALIVCPAILKYNWLKEARKWMIGHITAYIYEGKKIRKYEKQLTNQNKKTILHIINYDILEKFKDRLLATPFNFFIADECQKIKNENAIRTKIAQELARKAKWKIFITGTPIYNKPKDLFVPLNLIDPEMFGNFYEFAQRYCGAQKIKIGSRSVMKYESATKVDELNTILRAKYMVRRMTVDVMKDLPEKIKDVIILNEYSLEELVEKEKKALENGKIEEEKLKKEVDELREMAKTDQGYEAVYKEKVKSMREIKFKNFGEIARIRKELAIKKAPYVINFVKDILEDSEDPQSKVVVFGHHTEVLEKIYTELKKFNPIIITGKVSSNERQRSIALFGEKNDTRVAVLSMGAAGTGVDGLQNFCNIIVFAELDWTPSLVDQAESRCHRIGQKNTVWIYHIVANDSIDSRIVKLMMEKEAVSKEILDYRPEQVYDMLKGDQSVEVNI
jgi:SWI/SNF-related matrix-associated actin-dependent regulator 1 of chromatin subfamily A